MKDKTVIKTKRPSLKFQNLWYIWDAQITELQE